ncbi:hypothetical protein BC827DRAFT_1159630 [Russula dissimulans]|nr:hypothetical protein BC827DRAFT_1159630 [Russula dissimulans]
MVLHPKYKLRYFEKQGWDHEWIETAKTIVQEEFKTSYADYMVCKPMALEQASKASNCLDSDLLTNEMMDSSSDKDEFVTELDQHLLAKQIKTMQKRMRYGQMMVGG